MKKLIFLFALVCAFVTKGAMAQSSVYRIQPTQVTLGGSFNNGTGDTLTKVWATVTSSGKTGTSTFPLFYTRLDSVVNTAAANDSVWAKMPQYYDHVSLEIKATRVGSVRCDSTTFNVWGSMSNTNWNSGAYKLLTTFTMANSASTQVFQYALNSGTGNPYTGIRVTATNGNLSTNSKVEWQGFLLIR